jgi:hypothetical protein
MAPTAPAQQTIDDAAKAAPEKESHGTSPEPEDRPERDLIVREEFSSSQSQAVVETASVALAAQARAQVEARYLMAERHPRDMDVVREKLLKDCRRPKFALAAEYSKPIGGKRVTGASIRFIETALRHYGNVLGEVAAVYDDSQKRIVRVTVTDLETNLTLPMDVTVEKTVERSQPRLGEGGRPEYISVRKNTNNQNTYLVAATEDDMLNKERALISKALRTVGERLLPVDLKEDAIELCRKTVRDRVTTDPDAERKSLADGFAALNVPVTELKAYIGHEIATCSPAELIELRKVWTAIRDGDAVWKEVFAAKTEANGGGAPSGTSKADALKDKLAGGGAQKAATT